MEVLAEVGTVAPSPVPARPLMHAELVDHVRGSSAIVSMLYDEIDEDVLTAAGVKLQVVSNVAVGYENIQVSVARHLGVTVTNTPDVLTAATADLTLGLIIMVSRRLSEGERLIRSRTPWHWDIDFHLGASLEGRTLGIIGMGAIGSAVGERATAFGMRVVYTRRSNSPDSALAGAERVMLLDLLTRADVVTIHCPLTPETHHLIDADALRVMKPTAFLINTARGPIVDEVALAEALAGGRLAGAALDVFESEPEVNLGLLEAENTVLTPHLGSATREVRAAMALLAAKNVAAVLGGKPPLTPVPRP
jgi:lactate dehydrogenase-like 2-hydroxyacid dehydrogenase